MQEAIDKFFIEASNYLGGLDAKKTASMQSIFSKICRDLKIKGTDKKRRESLALLILCSTTDDEGDDEVYDSAHRWMRFLASSEPTEGT